MARSRVVDSSISLFDDDDGGRGGGGLLCGGGGRGFLAGTLVEFILKVVAIPFGSLYLVLDVISSLFQKKTALLVWSEKMPGRRPRGTVQLCRWARHSKWKAE